MTFDDYVVATSEPGTDPYRTYCLDPDCNEQPDPGETQCRTHIAEERAASIKAANLRMMKLRPTGDGHRDRLVAARLQVRRTHED